MGDAQTVTPPTIWNLSEPVEPNGHGHTRFAPVQLDVAARVEGFDLWDLWPVETAEGELHQREGASLWMVLAAPWMPDPEARHGLARIHFMTNRDGRWTMHGPVFRDGASPGSREWSGSAVIDPVTSRLTVFFTATGRRGETIPSFEQRLVQAEGTLRFEAGQPRLANCKSVVETVAPDTRFYIDTAKTGGVAGTIKGFRDPGYFRDPASGRQFLFFTGSSATDRSDWNGVIGVAEANGTGLDDWQLLAPVVSAAGLNNELERPHMRLFDGSYWLFWSTQAKVFAAVGPRGPTGLYAMVGESPLGPFKPVNGTGLVAGNPDCAPSQAYSWWVMADRTAIAFVDLPGIRDIASLSTVAQRREAFGGYPGMPVQLQISGDSAGVAPR